MESLAPTAAATAYPPPIAEDLARVEERLGEELVSRESRLGAIATHLLGAGGKRIRPTVVLLAFHAAGNGAGRRADAIEAAVALELIHSATLLHDDIIDAGDLRRGRPSALRTFGVADTLVAGDFLFSRAFALCARFEPVVIRWAADACVSLTEGEIMQGRFRHNPAVTVADYLEIIRRKTASLFAAGARTAGHLAGASPDLVDAMAAAGEHIGLAFQVSDDLLDVV
ncbi:MAG TPA: polyprenyl synthetase family protein, partial [Solirubrobacteraceae bacterium]